MKTLLVEDDRVVLRMMEDFLRHRGHTVVPCENGQEAWAKYLEEPFSLIVTDWLMEGMSGVDLVRQIRKAPNGHFPVILVITVKNSAHDVKEALAAGADDFISKPMNPDLLNVRLSIAESKVRSQQSQRVAEEARHEAEERFAQLVTHIPQAFWIANPERTTFEYVSPAAGDVYGHLPGELYGDPEIVRRNVHPDDRDRLAQAYCTICEDGNAVEYRIQLPDQEPRWIRERGFPVHDEAGKVVRIAGIAEDISAMVKAQKERDREEARKRELLERTSRLTSLGLLAAGVAHEVNNPLQGMLSHLRSVRRSLGDDFPEMESVEMIERGMMNIAALTSKLLSIGNAGADDEARAVAGEVIEFVERLLRSQLRNERIEIAHSGNAQGMMLAISRRELTQALMNLVINARDAMPDGGTLEFSIDQVEEFGVICVRDTGPGIPEEIRDKIFTPFYTQKGNQGNGLGLSVVESIVRKAQGELEVDNAPEGGALFTLRIPLVSEKVACAVVEERTEPSGLT